jgi:hypothetical protein
VCVRAQELGSRLELRKLRDENAALKARLLQFEGGSAAVAAASVPTVQPLPTSPAAATAAAATPAAPSASAPTSAAAPRPSALHGAGHHAVSAHQLRSVPEHKTPAASGGGSAQNELAARLLKQRVKEETPPPVVGRRASLRQSRRSTSELPQDVVAALQRPPQPNADGVLGEMAARLRSL